MKEAITRAFDDAFEHLGVEVIFESANADSSLNTFCMNCDLSQVRYEIYFGCHQKRNS
jgi:hypothetical protein